MQRETTPYATFVVLTLVRVLQFALCKVDCGGRGVLLRGGEVGVSNGGLDLKGSN